MGATSKITDITDVLIVVAKRSAERWIEQNKLSGAHALAVMMVEFANIVESFDHSLLDTLAGNPTEDWYFIAYGQPKDYEGIVPPGVFYIEPTGYSGTVMFEFAIDDATIIRIAEGHHTGRILVIPNDAKRYHHHENRDGRRQDDDKSAVFTFEYEGVTYNVYPSSAYTAWGKEEEDE